MVQFAVPETAEFESKLKASSGGWGRRQEIVTAPFPLHLSYYPRQLLLCILGVSSAM